MSSLNDMAGLTRFSVDERMRMKKLTEHSCKTIAEIINRDRPSDRLCTARGVRICLKRIKSPVTASKRVYQRRLGPAALSSIDGEVENDNEISALELQRLFTHTAGFQLGVCVCEPPI